MGRATKPGIFNAFANAVSGSLGDFFNVPVYLDNGFGISGGDPERPPLGYVNWLFYQATNFLKYAMQRGISDWDAAEDGYGAGDIVRNGGVFWVCGGGPTTGLAPSSDPAHWELWLGEPVMTSLADALGGVAASFDGPSNPTAWNDLLGTHGTHVSGLDVLPTFAAGSGFGVLIGSGAGYLETTTGINTGESSYRKLRWTGASLTHATPDATNDRIDAITVQPGAFGAASTLAIVTGTPAATPLAPAIPAGKGALFYVLIPAAGADSSVFRACRGMWRRTGYPFSGLSGVLAGCQLFWDYTADPATTSAQIYFGSPDDPGGSFFGLHRLLIDGEPVEWAGIALGGAGGGIVHDSTANPFGTTASSNFDRPYYIYAAGGRHNPLPVSVQLGGALSPVTIVESTIPPNVQTGKPTANMTVNGVTVVPDGAVYLGLGFVVQGTTRRRACIMDAEMTTAINPLQIIKHTFTTAGSEDIGTFSGNSQPAISTKMVVNIGYTNLAFASPATVRIILENAPLVVGDPQASAGILVHAETAGKGHDNMVPIAFNNHLGSELWAIASGSGDILQVGAMGFNHRVNRLCGAF